VQGISVLHRQNTTHNNINLSSVQLYTPSGGNSNSLTGAEAKLDKPGFGFEYMIDMLDELEPYIAPESLKTSTFDKKSDIYAL